jgi:hypothetical protein
MTWQETTWDDLDGENIGKPLYVEYPDEYNLDYAIGVLDYVYANNIQVHVGLRGLKAVELYKETEHKQPLFFVWVD